MTSALEIQLLENDAPARRVVEDGPVQVRVASGLAEALPGVARLMPLMISFDHLLSHPAPAALGEERFTVEARRAVPVRVPDERLEGGPERFDIIELTAGELEIAAMVPHDTEWPHVTVHRAYPRSHDFERVMTPSMERAFLAALREAVRALFREKPGVR